MLFRFSLGRIPVEVHASHFLVSGVIAYLYREPHTASLGAEAARWPYRALLDATAADHTATLLAYVAIWMGIVFLSVLVHELGHAVVSRAYGYRPSISLVWLGGHTNPNAGETIPWHKDILLTLAGPGFGLLLAALSLGALAVVSPESEALTYILKLCATANLFWAVLNLLPVMPLDGGRVLNALLVRGFGKKGFIFGQVTSLLLATLGLAYGAARGDLGLILIASFVGMSAFSLLTRAMKGESVEAPRHPYELAFDQAKAFYRDGKLDVARAQAELVLVARPEASPSLQSQVHHLLGWVALKEGRGRWALEHFAKVQRTPVEPHALAAAFSLAGEDDRALTLWELAWRETRDRTVRHEYAGTLLRVQGADALSRLADVDRSLAYTCAVRLLSLRGELARAGALAEEGSSAEARFALAYDGACAYARHGDADGALRLLERAGELGFRDWDYAASDADLERLHTDPRFPEFLRRMKGARVG